MPRQPRTSSGTGIYHVMLRGINRQDIFEEQGDYQQFLIRLQNLIDPIDDNGEHIQSYFHVYAYCLMSNHVHLLLRERTESISISLKRLTVSYEAYYNKRYKRVGHLFQDRFKSEPVNDIEYFITLLRYVHQNPVKAGICVKAEEYTWSSWQEYRQYLRGHWHLEHPTDLQKKKKTDRNEILIEAIRYGAPLRQLSD